MKRPTGQLELAGLLDPGEVGVSGNDLRDRLAEVPVRAELRPVETT
jgi:hypothetical protein